MALLRRTMRGLTTSMQTFADERRTPSDVWTNDDDVAEIWQLRHIANMDQTSNIEVTQDSIEQQGQAWLRSKTSLIKPHSKVKIRS
jgi:hypothetical protein